MDDNNLEIEIRQEVKEQFKGSEMSKAGKLAMELASEKKRLKQEMAELQSEVEDLTPTTPVGTPDWYIKWLAMITGVLGVFMIAAGFEYYGLWSYIASSVGWVVVGVMWGDRAIMIGSSISGTAIMLNIVERLTL